jgi:hypothetical protein
MTMTCTRDIGLFIRDMIEHSRFVTYIEQNGELVGNGGDSIKTVDVGDPNNLIIRTANGFEFLVCIFAIEDTS